MAIKVQGHVINGEHKAQQSSAYIDVINPANGEIVAQTTAGTAEEVDKAVAAAKAAFPGWRSTPASERAALIARIALVLGANLEELIELECSCTGILASRMASFDVPALMQIIQTFAENLEDYPFVEYPPVRTLPEAHDVKVFKEPLGVCGLISPWNAPLFVTFVKMIPALAAGNTVVIKPSESSSVAIVRVAELLQSILPPGVVNVVTGYGHEAGAALVAHPDVAKISFTGSTNTGRMIQRTAADTMKRVTLELGGKGAGIALPDAPIELTARGATFAFLFHAGQVCISGTRLFIHESIHDQVVARMVHLAEALKPGGQFDPQTTLAPMAFKAHYDRVMGYIDSAKEQGATLVCGGEPMVVPGAPESLFIQPTIFTDVTDHMTIAREEIFGPVMSVLDFDTEEEVMARANDTEFGLAAGVFTNDLTRAHRIVAGFEAGTCYINTYNLAPVEAPFGGSKMSGVGRENSKLAINHFSEMKTVYVSMNDVEAPY